ncbi:MAG: prolyl oligopeptidase family serine peptidase [Sandaracinaceae bacterium]|nr:prolyl oligopeptidase family serine peptidase [Sandaracinaceae bacterium]
MQLWTTPDELWMNLDDLTAPDVVVGETDEQWVGVPVLNLTDHPALDTTARVVGDDRWEETTTLHRSLPGGAVTQVAFRLVPRAAFGAPETDVPVRVRIESRSMRWFYERELSVDVLARGEPYRRTFRSGIDGSAQYYGVRPPPDGARGEGDALVLALHGASVQAIGHASAYSGREWAWVVAPTNRRPFGFDWEVWGRLDALEVLEDAARAFGTDPTRVYVTGHSMGGHGTWQLGTLFPGRFAVVAPSAGWASFYTYVGAARPTGAFARSMASSDTPRYASNLARRRVYVLHGDADDNVPVREARDMVALLTPIVATDMLEYHEEPGAGHWWDGEAAPGADCVDWLPIFEAMEASALDPTELEFDFPLPPRPG